MGKLGLKTTTATVPRQWRQKCLSVFLNDYERICKRTVYRCSTSPGEYSGYHIFLGNGGVTVF
jgi:hypothetical protein